MISDCCGEYMDGLMQDIGVCPCCKEHCEVVEEYDDSDVKFDEYHDGEIDKGGNKIE